MDVCHTGALSFGEESDFADFIDGASVRLPESGTGPKVYYRNIPGRFIGGTIYDPDEEVVVRNARCVLTGDGKTWETVTDFFGDFWFRDLPHGKFHLDIEAEGFETLHFPEIDTEENSVNLGDQPMNRKKR